MVRSGIHPVSPSVQAYIEALWDAGKMPRGTITAEAFGAKPNRDATSEVQAAIDAAMGIGENA